VLLCDLESLWRENIATKAQKHKGSQRLNDDFYLERFTQWILEQGMQIFDFRSNEISSAKNS